MANMQTIPIAILLACALSAAADDPTVATGPENPSEILNGLPNILTNPGFEDSGQGWTLPATCAVSGEAPRSGKTCLHMRNTDPKTYLMARQTLPVETGACYRFTAWIRTRGVKGNGSGATGCAEWSGPEGHIGGTYPGGRGGDQDWFLIEGLTPPMPSGATSLNLNLYLRKGMTGEAWFDDVSVAEEMPRAIDCARFPLTPMASR